MQQYTISPEAVVKLIRKAQLPMLIFMIVVVAFGTVIGMLNAGDKASSADGVYIFIPFIIAVLGYTFFRTKQTNQNIFTTYKLTITNNLITREMDGFQEISIYFNDVTEIIKRKNGSFTIKGKAKADLIGVPAEIDNYAALEKRLNEIKSISENVPLSFIEKYPFALILLAIASMAGVYAVNNKIVVLLSGIIVSVILIWGFVESRRSKNISDKVKRSMWWVLIVLLSVIVTVITKLTGLP